MRVSRRTALGALAGTLVSVNFQRVALGQANPRTRFNATSSEGKKNLKSYALAVERMMNQIPATSHQSWLFQWYTHFVRGDRDKLDEIEKVFGDANSLQKDLANLMWSSCRAHSGGFQGHFLPWHRAYLVCFEDIIRDVSGDEEFTLPYWDYTNDSHIPPEFTDKDDPQFASLFIASRNNFINGGQAIEDIAPGLLNLEAMDIGHLLDEGGEQGFSRHLDGNLHGNLHSAVGTGTNMGSVPYAAGDPIFWLHHCNIDRVWASWNKMGGKNPPASDWQDDVTHVFADRKGSRYERTNTQLEDTLALEYQYDTLLAAPAGSSAIMSVGNKSAITLARANQPIRLDKVRNDVRLEPTSSAASAEVENIEPDKERFVLVVGDLKSPPSRSAGLYKVYASIEGQSEDQSALVGYINFFDVSDTEKQFAFEVNKVVEAAIRKGKDIDLLSYRFVAVAEETDQANATIGRLELVKN